MVLQMLKLLALALWFVPAAFWASPLTAADGYGAPDPGWYGQGSGYRPDAGRYSGAGRYGGDSGSSLYDQFRSRDDGSASDYGDGGARGYPSYDRFADDRDSFRPTDRPGYEPYEARYRSPDEDSRPAPTAEDWRRDPPKERLSPDGYGAPDWAQEPLPQYREQTAPASDWGYRDDRLAAPGGSQGRDNYSDLGLPAARPRYRFRDDPKLERQPDDVSGDYRFRPLTRKEQTRRQDATRDTRFVDRDRSRRDRPPKGDDRGTAFGYEPGPGVSTPDDFYRRYYRSGP